MRIRVQTKKQMEVAPKFAEILNAEGHSDLARTGREKQKVAVNDTPGLRIQEPEIWRSRMVFEHLAPTHFGQEKRDAEGRAKY